MVDKVRNSDGIVRHNYIIGDSGEIGAAVGNDDGDSAAGRQRSS